MTTIIVYKAQQTYLVKLTDRRNIMANLKKTGKIVTWETFGDKLKNYILKCFIHAEDIV